MGGRRESNRNGFTLVELATTVSVMVVLAVAAVPSFADFLDRAAVRGAAEGAADVVSNARTEAVKNNLDVSVAMQGSGTDWCLGANAATPPSGGQPALAAAACDCGDASQCQVSGQRLATDANAFPGVRLASAMTPLTFDRQMGVVTPLGTHNLTLTSPRGKYYLSVDINALGHARLCVPAGKPEMTGVPQC